MSLAKPILEGVKRQGVLFGVQYEMINRIFAAIFIYLRAQNQLASWRDFCKEFNVEKLQRVAAYFRRVKFPSDDFEIVHPYAEMKEATPKKYPALLYYNESVLSEISRLASMASFPLSSPENSIPVTAFRLSDARFPSTEGKEIARGEENWQRVHRFSLHGGAVLLTNAPNDMVAQQLESDYHVSVIVALCNFSVAYAGSLARSRDRDSCMDYRSVLRSAKVIHHVMEDNTFCLVKADEWKSRFEPLKTAFSFINGLLKRLSAGENIAIHCFSGVGRAGSLNLLLHAMQDRKFSEFFLKIHRPEDLTEASLATLAQMLAEILAQLRQVRYAVQAKKQFLDVLAHLVLFKLIERNVLSEDNVEAFLREMLRNEVGVTMCDIFSVKLERSNSAQSIDSVVSTCSASFSF